MSDPVMVRVEQMIQADDVVLFMKGTPSEPRCGFSQRAVDVLRACGCHEFKSIDVLAEPDVRATLPRVSDWPTFPQLFIQGELVGGSDIMWQHYEQGTLQSMLKDVQAQDNT